MPTSAFQPGVIPFSAMSPSPIRRSGRRSRPASRRTARASLFILFHGRPLGAAGEEILQQTLGRAFLGKRQVAKISRQVWSRIRFQARRPGHVLFQVEFLDLEYLQPLSQAGALLLGLEQIRSAAPALLEKGAGQFLGDGPVALLILQQRPPSPEREQIQGEVEDFTFLGATGGIHLDATASVGKAGHLCARGPLPRPREHLGGHEAHLRAGGHHPAEAHESARVVHVLERHIHPGNALDAHGEIGVRKGRGGRDAGRGGLAAGLGGLQRGAPGLVQKGLQARKLKKRRRWDRFPGCENGR